MEVRRLAARKEEIYRELLGDRTPLVPSGLQKLMDTLNTHKVGHARPCLHAVVRGGGTFSSTCQAEAVHAALHTGTHHLCPPARQQRALQVYRQHVVHASCCAPPTPPPPPPLGFLQQASRMQLPQLPVSTLFAPVFAPVPAPPCRCLWRWPAQPQRPA